MKKQFSRLNLISVIWFALGFQSSLPAAAHPLDEYYQVTYITVAPNRINLAIELYPSVLIAPQILTLIDANQDDEISTDEQQAYISLFTGDVIFEVDGKPIALQAANIEFPPALDIRGGGGVIRFTLYADLPSGHRGGHQFYYQNNHLPEIGTYLVNALSDAPALVQITKQDKDVFQTSLRLDYTIALDAPVDNEPVEAVADVSSPPKAAPSAGQERLTRYLYDPQVSPFFMVVVLGVAIALGGLHALTPGHGKTLVAAYLIGSRGTVKHAVFLGGIVTFTHTASVIIIGLLALLASQFLVPNVFVPVLEIASGLLVVYLGVQLLWTRWREYKHKAYHHHHPAEHNHSHPHGHEHHLPESIKLRDLLALGISGGLVPCPEALGIMLIAIGLNRITMGLGMVVAFSFGLAAVLIVIGVLLVRTKSLLDRWGAAGSRWQTLLPVVSAVIVTLLGLGIVLKGLWPYLAGY